MMEAAGMDRDRDRDSDRDRDRHRHEECDENRDNGRGRCRNSRTRPPFITSLLLVLGALCWVASFPSISLGFNLEPRASHLYAYPYAPTQERESYFGFSVALHHNFDDNSNWVMVGAPRANSSIYNPRQITEPGALFKCDLSGRTCLEVIVDRSGNTEVINDKSQYSYQDLKNNGWLGGALDSQPLPGDNRQVTGVCAPRWSNQLYYPQLYMNGACYWVDESAPVRNIKKELPLVDHKSQTKLYQNNRFYHYAHGQAGMSIHFPEDHTEFIIGAPGVFNWHGSVILFKDFSWDNSGGISSKRRRRQSLQQQMFDTEVVPDPSFISSIKDGNLFGYSVTSGRFLSEDQILYAGGAPRGSDFYGKVIVFDFPSADYVDLITRRELKGGQLGEYFGASLAAADVNGDGLADLVVGSPMFSRPNLPDVGRIHTFISEEGKGLHRRPNPHYGKDVSLGRFGTSIMSPGDLNADGYDDILVGAPWEGNGAVYVFLGSFNGLKQQYAQRLSPQDFPPAVLRGFGMSMSRGIDTDDNGYPDLAIGSFLSGHVVVVKTRPVAILSSQVRSQPPNVPWEGSVQLQLTTCLKYSGHRIPKQYYVQASLTLDSGSPSPRASFPDNSFVYNFTEILTANSLQPSCRIHQVTVKNNKIDPDQPLDMKLDYELVNARNTPLIKQPMTNPNEAHSSTARVNILKGCVEKVCRVDMMFDADLGLGQGKKLVVGQKTKLVMKTTVSNTGEPAYLPSMNVTVGHPLSLILPQTHDCKFFNPDLRTSLVCNLANPIRKSKTDIVEVSVDTSQLTDVSSNPWIRVNVTGEGEELKPLDNQLFMSLPLEAHASLELFGDSKEEQVFYKHVDENKINATINPRFTHTYILVKKGPTPLGQVDLTVDIPVNLTDGKKLVKLFPPKTNFLSQSFICKLSSGSFDRDDAQRGSGMSSGGIVNGGDKEGDHDTEQPSLRPIIVSAEKDASEGLQYFNCSSSLVKCVRLLCHINNWPVDTESAKVTMELEVNLKAMAKHMSVKGGAVLTTTGRATIQSLQQSMAFTGIRVASEEVVTQIQPDSLLGKGVPWWVILLAVLGGLLLLALLAYGLYKTGFFKREKMEEMKAQQAEIKKNSYGTPNPSHVGD